MSFYNFRSEFVDAVVEGRASQTIRKPRRFPDRPGSTMSLFTQLRRANARLLFRAPCLKVETVVLWKEGDVWLADGPPLMGLSEQGWSDLAAVGLRCGFRALSQAEKEAFAIADGFRNWKAFLRCRRKDCLPFYGGVWHWDFAQREVVTEVAVKEMKDRLMRTYDKLMGAAL